MSIYTYLVLCAVTGLLIGFCAGIAFEIWRDSRSEYRKAKIKFDAMEARVEKFIDEGRSKML